MEAKAAALDAVVARLAFERNDPLPAQHKPLDHPVERAAVERLGLALRPHAGDVERSRVTARRTPFGGARILPVLQVLDAFAADAELQEVDSSHNQH